MSEDHTARTSRDELTCSECGKEFEEYRVRKGYSDSPVIEVEELTCPNGHRGKLNYGYDGLLSQSMGVRGLAHH